MALSRREFLRGAALAAAVAVTGGAGAALPVMGVAEGGAVAPALSGANLRCESITVRQLELDGIHRDVQGFQAAAAELDLAATDAAREFAAAAGRCMEALRSGMDAFQQLETFTAPDADAITSFGEEIYDYLQMADRYDRERRMRRGTAYRPRSRQSTVLRSGSRRYSGGIGGLARPGFV